MIKRRFAVLIVSLYALLFAGAASASDYQDWWYDPANGGMGISIGQQNNTIFGAWYLYSGNGTATFLGFTGTLAGVYLYAPLTRYSGTPPVGYNPATTTGMPVGTVTVTFTSDTTATFNYSYDGGSGTLNLQRFTFAPLQLAGIYSYSYTTTVSGCTNPSNNGVTNGTATATFSTNGSSFMMYTSMYAVAGQCQYSGQWGQMGSKIRTIETIFCSGFYAPNASMSISLQDNFFVATESGSYVPGGSGSCSFITQMGGVRTQ
jgi:hypothetical protein